MTNMSIPRQILPFLLIHSFIERVCDDVCSVSGPVLTSDYPEMNKQLRTPALGAFALNANELFQF